MNKIDSLRKIEEDLKRGLKEQLLQLTRAGQKDDIATDIYGQHRYQREMRGMTRIIPREYSYYTAPNAQEQAIYRAQLVEYLENWVDLTESSLFPCPGLPWWIGTDRDWQMFIAPLEKRGYCEIDSGGKIVWKKTAGFAGIIARAAINKSWLQAYVGEESYPTFFRSHFSWPKGIPKSKNAFDNAHASLKDQNLAQPILKEYSFESAEIEDLLKNN